MDLKDVVHRHTGERPGRPSGQGAGLDERVNLPFDWAGGLLSTLSAGSRPGTRAS